MMDNSCQNKDTMNDCTPEVGMEFDMLEGAWMFWKNYKKNKWSLVFESIMQIKVR